MHSPLRFDVSEMSGFSGSKRAKTSDFASQCNLRSPNAIFVTPRCAKKSAAFISYGGRSPVLIVFRSRRFPKINQAIIRTDSVYMINVMRRKVSMHVNPNETVSKKIIPVYVDLDIASVVLRPRDCTNSDASRGDFDPSETAGARVVAQKLAQAKHANILITHGSSYKAVVVRSRGCVDAQSDSAHYIAAA